MYRKIANALHVLNILVQALYTLALPIGLGALISFLLTKYANAPGWIWAVLLVLGVGIGFYSMIKFILTASRTLERIEAEQKARDREKEKDKEKKEGDTDGTK